MMVLSDISSFSFPVVLPNLSSTSTPEGCGIRAHGLRHESKKQNCSFQLQRRLKWATVQEVTKNPKVTKKESLPSALMPEEAEFVSSSVLHFIQNIGPSTAQKPSGAFS